MSSRKRAPAADPAASLPADMRGGYWSWLLAGGMCDDCRARVIGEHGTLGPYPHCHRRWTDLLDDHLDRIGWTSPAAGPHGWR